MDFADLLLRFVLLVPAVIVAIPAHEIGHAAAAYLLGDRSVRYFGYFKPELRRYLDPYGVLAVAIALVGWGRRVPVQANRIDSTGKKLLVELGGPAANLALAIVLGLLYQALSRMGFPGAFDFSLQLLPAALFVIVFLNLSIFAFQLLPIPGLDGWNIVELLFRSRNPRFFYDVAIRRREIWAGCVIVLVAFQLLGRVNILWYVMAPFYEPASLISLRTCAGYATGISALFPCLL